MQVLPYVHISCCKYVLHHQSLFLLGVHFESHNQNAEIRCSVVCHIRKLLVPCEGSLGKGGIVYRQK